MLIIANWKMFPETLDEAKSICKSLTRTVAALPKKTRLVVCPPSLYIVPLLKTTPSIQFGAQDVSLDKGGTGAISATMLKEAGAKMTIIGHSERRALGETDAVVAEKACAAFKSNLEVVLCVGESNRDGEGQYLEGLKHQLLASLEGVDAKHTKKLIVAYEPVWAVGANYDTALAPAELEQTALFIRKTLINHFGKVDGARIAILYGGSVSPESAGDLLKRGGVSGLLIGRQSRVAKSLIEILKVA